MFPSDLYPVGTPPRTLFVSRLREQGVRGPEGAEGQGGFEEELKACLGCML